MKKDQSLLLITAFFFWTQVIGQGNSIKAYGLEPRHFCLTANGQLLATNGSPSIQSVYRLDSTGNILWENNHSFDYNSCGLVECTSKELLVSTGWNSPNGILNPGIFKLDSSGNFLSAKYYSCDTIDCYLQSMVRTTDNNNVLIGIRPISAQMNAMIKLDDNGTIIWEKKASTGGWNFDFLAPIEDGGLIVSHEGDFDNGNVLKIDSAGSVVWANQYTFNNIFLSNLWDVQRHPNGNYELLFTVTQNTDSIQMIYLIISPGGTPLYCKGYHFNGNSIPNNAKMCVDIYGQVLTCFNLDNEMYVMRMDGQGNPIWLDKAIPWMSSLGIKSINSTEYFVTSLSPAGGLIIKANDRLSDLFSCFAPASVTGVTQIVAATPFTISFSNITCTTVNFIPPDAQWPFGVTDYCIANVVANESHLAGWKIYPNPATDYISINFQGLSIRNAALKIYSQEGELCLFNKEINGDEKIFTDNLAPGIYVVVLQTESLVYSSKLVVMKH